MVMGILDEFFDSLPEFNWTGIDLDESINKWIGDALSPVASVMGMSDGDVKKTINMLSSVPIIGDYFRMSDQMNMTEDYMKNRGLAWDDVKYPALLNNGQNSMTNILRSGTNFVSKNIERLYD